MTKTNETEDMLQDYKAVQSALYNILEKLEDNIDFCNEVEDIRGYLDDAISDYYKANPVIRKMEIKKHFLIKKSKLHFYVVGFNNALLHGFLIHGRYGWCNISQVIEPYSKWKRYECHDNPTFPRTLGDIFDEYEKGEN